MEEARQHAIMEEARRQTIVEETRRDEVSKMLSFVQDSINGDPRILDIMWNELKKVVKVIQEREKYLKTVHEEGESSGAAKKRKTGSGIGKQKENAEVSNSLFIWLIPFTRTEESQNQFKEDYLSTGFHGYQKFQKKLYEILLEVCDRLYPDKGDNAQMMVDRFQKKDGVFDNMILTLSKETFEIIKQRDLEMFQRHVSPFAEENAKSLFRKWSDAFRQCKLHGSTTRSSDIAANCVVPISMRSNKKIRPSRGIYGGAMMTFITRNKLKPLDGNPIGEGVGGQVRLCTISDMPYLNSTATLAMKEFTEGKRDAQKRKLAVNEAIVCGLDHLGIVSTLAMTTNDPPILVYDYYNGGDLADMIDKVHKSGWPKEPVMYRNGYKPVDIAEMTAFMEGRVGIFWAILETMQFLHNAKRLHCDLHLGNILLHFEYDHPGRPDANVTKVAVGICDWGRALYWSDAPKAKRIAANLKDFCQHPPELLCEKPAAYSEVTDVYSVGNILCFLLDDKAGYPFESAEVAANSAYGRKRRVCEGWEIMHDKQVTKMKQGMCNDDPKERKDLNYWAKHMWDHFHQNLKILTGSSNYLWS